MDLDECPPYVVTQYDDMLKKLREKWSLEDDILNRKYQTLKTLATETKKRRLQAIEHEHEESLKLIDHQQTTEQQQVNQKRIDQVKTILHATPTSPFQTISSWFS